MDKTQVTLKAWKDTLIRLRMIKDITNEPIVLILHRLVVTELNRRQIEIGGRKDANQELH